MRTQSRGFTLLELTVVLVIAGLTLMVALPAVSNMLGKDLKQASRELSSSIRTVYDQSFLKNRPMRIVWNIDRNTYWFEVGSTEARIFRNVEEREQYERFLADNEQLKERLTEEKQRDEERARSNIKPPEITNEEGENIVIDLFSNIFNSGDHKAVHPADYQGVNGFQADPEEPARELPDGIRFAGVLTYAYPDVVRPSEEAPEGPQDEAIVSTTFFPSGYVEDTAVYITDGDRIWTLLIDPLTGNVSIVANEAPLPRYEERVIER